MGTALAQTLLGAGRAITAWNRSPKRTEALARGGATIAPTASGALAASPVSIVCIDSYASLRQQLEGHIQPGALDGRTVVQLTTGTPGEAKNAADWMASLGAGYLDGAILCSPQDIGTPASSVLLAGDAAAHALAAPVVSPLKGVRYLGPSVGAAAALDLAWLTTRFGRFVALAHATHICLSEGAEVSDFAALFPEDPVLQGYLGIVADNDYDSTTASRSVWAEALERIRRQGREAGIDTEIPDFFASLFGRALAAGHGERNVMSLVKVTGGPRMNGG